MDDAGLPKKCLMVALANVMGDLRSRPAPTRAGFTNGSEVDGSSRIKMGIDCKTP
jgi:hypothetical protein